VTGQRHAAQCVLLAIRIRCQPYNQENVTSWFINDLQALVYTFTVRPLCLGEENLGLFNPYITAVTLCTTCANSEISVTY
jgi:hypothetical protein